MKKQTFVVVTPHGTLTRTTARAYAFVVVARGDRKTCIRRRNASDVEATISNRAYYLELIAELERGHKRYDHVEMSIDEERANLAAADAFLAGGWEGALCEALNASDAALLAPFAATSGVWSSRLDLARREFDKLAAHYRDVRVFEVATGREVLATTIEAQS
jgi:hypothetical protein